LLAGLVFWYRVLAGFRCVWALIAPSSDPTSALSAARKSLPRGPAFQFDKSIVRILCPTEFSDSTRSAYAREFGDAIRGSRVETVRDCGHIPQAEQRETTLALVLRFLAGS